MKLGDVATVIMGQSPPSSSVSANSADTPFLTTGEFGEKHPNLIRFTSKPLKMASINDVLITVVGNVGGVNLGADCAIGRSVASIRPSDDIDQLFLYYFLRSTSEQLANKSRGAIQKTIRKLQLEEIELPDLSVEEQKRIARILYRADEIVKSSEDSKILQERITESLFIELFGDPILNQRGFSLTTLSDVCEVISGFAFKSAEYSENPSHINLVRGQNISHGFLDWKLGKYWEKMDDSLEKYQLLEGDVVLAMDRPIISTGLKISEITTVDMPALLVQRVARIRSSKLPSSFILTLLKHPIFIRTIESSKTETTIPHITLRNVKELQFPLPPPELLEQFSKTMHLIEQLTFSSSERRSFSENFKRSLTQEMLT